MQILKPTHKKHKAKNNKRILERKPCECCGCFRYLETHEVFGGSRRQISIDNNFQKEICNDCHRKITEWKITNNRTWQRQFQAEYLKTHTREEWFALIGKFYDL